MIYQHIDGNAAEDLAHVELEQGVLPLGAYCLDAKALSSTGYA
jgi:hypothetical protein